MLWWAVDFQTAGRVVLLRRASLFFGDGHKPRYSTMLLCYLFILSFVCFCHWRMLDLWEVFWTGLIVKCIFWSLARSSQIYRGLLPCCFPILFYVACAATRQCSTFFKFKTITTSTGTCLFKFGSCSWCHCWNPPGWCKSKFSHSPQAWYVDAYSCRC